MDLDLSRIQVYPTNEYSPAVHRLLQMTANLYEATTNSPFPTVFRPSFTSDGTNVFISGYELVNGPDTLPTSLTFLTVPIDLRDSVARASIGETPTHLNVYGVPWIIGARKGFPNLSAVAMQSVARITRNLLISRPDVLTTDFNQYRTSQLLVLCVSNTVGVEVWNSYRTNYPYSVPALLPARQVYVQADGRLLIALTNDLGYTATVPYVVGGPNTATYMGAIKIAAGQWQGTGWIPGAGSSNANPLSFQVPLLTNIVFLPDSGYKMSPPGFIPLPTNAPQSWSVNPPDTFPQPRWGLTISNSIRCMIWDGRPGQGRIVDYVQLNNLNSYRDLSGEIYTNDLAGGPNIHSMWGTNFVNPVYGVARMPKGVFSQIYISMGQPPTSDQDWQNTMIAPPAGSARLFAIDYFRAFLHLSPITYANVVNTQLVMQVPYTPTSKKYQPLIWQANNPRVHYTTADLTDVAASTNIYSVIPPAGLFPQVSSNFWTYNKRYRPWGGNPMWGLVDWALDLNMAVKDPMVRAPDDWDFPAGEPLSLATLGRIHRGTPWQTIYLKSAAVDRNVWARWMGLADYSAALATMPTNDWRLVTLLGLMLNTNHPHHLLSINNPDTNAWLEVLDGLTVITNSWPPIELVMSSNSPQAALIAAAIQQVRAAQPGQQFSHVGDVLATPQLSLASPWLNPSLFYYWDSLSDEACEIIPSQLLSRLREDSIGSITRADNRLEVQFSGYDHWAYAIETSSDLEHWFTVGTKHPSYGVFGLQLSPSAKGRPWFYRSVLLP